jgi:4-amino-4-deoxy-L-arabinose transferase-like glycosyltransferase
LTEREWREASDLRPPKVALALVILTAAILRFWSLRHGLPYSPAVDEPEIVGRSLNMMRTGNFSPHPFYDYPTLYMYLQLVVFVLRFLLGAMTSAWSSLAEIDTTAFFVSGRAVAALFGTATVLLVFHAGLRWGARHALLAAGLLAVMPIHVRESHYVLTDTPMTFFVTLTLVLALAASERMTVAAFAWAGAAAGLAAATKYNGGLALIMPLIACAMLPPGKVSRGKCALAAIAAALAAFLAGAPYTVLDLPGFLNSFARLATHYQKGAVPAEAPSVTYLKHLYKQWGYPAFILSLAGLVLGFVRIARGPGRVRWLVVIAFTLIYFVLIARQQIVFARYLLPIIPMLCLLAATAVISGVSLLRRYEIPRGPRTALIVALTLVGIVPGAVNSVRFDIVTGRGGTWALAYDWISKNIPKGSYVVLETRQILLPAEQYKSDHMSQLRQKAYEDYKREGVQYLVASSQCYGPYFQDSPHFPTEYSQYMQIFVQSRELVRFTPEGDKVPGPELRIFKVQP